jgi:hypothetical protein
MHNAQSNRDLAQVKTAELSCDNLHHTRRGLMRS